MSVLYGQLNRLFQEVSPLLPAMRKKSSHRKLANGLFTEASELAWVQVLPGIYAQGLRTQAAERPCLVAVDAPKPLLFPGTMADFGDAQFRYPAYQIPVYAGNKGGFNVDAVAAAKALSSEALQAAILLNADLKTLIHTIAYSPPPASLGFILMEKLKVLLPEDYLKPGFLRNIKVLITNLSDAVADLSASNVDAVEVQVAQAKRDLKALSIHVGLRPAPREIFASFLQEAIPDLKYFFTSGIEMLDLISQHDLIDAEPDADYGWVEQISTKPMKNVAVRVNPDFMRFAQWQLESTS